MNKQQSAHKYKRVNFLQPTFAEYSFLGNSTERIKICTGHFKSNQIIMIVLLLYYQLIYQQEHKIMISSFSPYQFQLALNNTAKIKHSLEPFILQYKRRNMYIILQIQAMDYRLPRKIIGLNYTFNSLFAIKFIIDNADIIMINMVETYLLPKIYEIASFDLGLTDKRKLNQYFIMKGFKGERAELEYYGFNYIRIAKELILVSAQIKPKRLYGNIQLEYPSDFQLFSQKLKGKGLKPFSSYAFYRKDYIHKSRTTFLAHLQTYGKFKTHFEEHFVTIIRQFLINNTVSHSQIQLTKILEKGEMPVCRWVLRECFIGLKSDNLNERRRALIVINDFVRWGDIFVAYAINCQGVADDIINEVSISTCQQKSVKRALMLFKTYQNSQQQKILYYCELLKSIEFWALCYPSALKIARRVSSLNNFYVSLKEGLKLQFPEFQNLMAQQAVFRSNNSKKHKLNLIILKDLTKEDINFASLKLVKPSNGTLSNPSTYRPLFDKFKQEIVRTRDILNNIYTEDSKISEFIPILAQFQMDFDLKIQNGGFNSDQLQFIINQGVPLLERIENILPSLQQYKTKQITLIDLKNVLLEKNKQITMSRIFYDVGAITKRKSYSSKQAEASSNIMKNSLEEELRNCTKAEIRKKETQNQNQQFLPKPIIKYTESYDFAMNSNPFQKQNPVSQNKKKRKPSCSEGDLSDINHQDLMYSKPQNERYPDNCLKIGHPIQSLAQCEGKYGVTFKKIDTHEPHSKFLYDKYLNGDSKITEKRYEDEKSDKIVGSSKLDQPYEPSFGNINQMNRADEIQQEGIRNSPLFGQFSGDFENIVPISNEPLLSKLVTCKFSIQELGFLENQENISKKQASRCSSEPSQILLKPDLEPTEFSYWKKQTAEEIIQSKPSSFLRFLEEDKDYISTKKKSYSLKLLQGTKQIIKPLIRRRLNTLNTPISHKRSIFIKKIGEDNQKQTAAQSIATGKGSMLKIKKEELDVFSQIALKLKLNSKEKVTETARTQQPLTAKIISEENSEQQDRNSFKNLFLNSKVRRNSLNALKNEAKKMFLDDNTQINNEIRVTEFKQYFENVSLEEDRKNQLKSKMLLLKNQVVQIGCVTGLENWKYTITLFILSRQNLRQFSFSVQGEDKNIIIKHQEDKKNIDIPAGKQRKIKIQIKIAKIPYKIPLIQFKFKTHSQTYSHSFPFPCSFHKFVSLEPLKDEEALSYFTETSKIFKTQIFKYSVKILKIFTDLQDFFPNGTFLRGGTPNKNGEVEYVGAGVRDNVAFCLKICLKKDHMMQISVSSQSKSWQSLKFLMATIANLMIKK